MIKRFCSYASELQIKYEPQVLFFPGWPVHSLLRGQSVVFFFPQTSPILRSETKEDTDVEAYGGCLKQATCCYYNYIDGRRVRSTLTDGCSTSEMSEDKLCVHLKPDMYITLI